MYSWRSNTESLLIFNLAPRFTTVRDRSNARGSQIKLSLLSIWNLDVRRLYLSLGGSSFRSQIEQLFRPQFAYSARSNILLKPFAKV